MTEQLTYRGQLEGHNGWVTAVATTAEDPNMILNMITNMIQSALMIITVSEQFLIRPFH